MTSIKNPPKRMPTYFISHGGGPWPWLAGRFRDALEPLKISLEALPSELPEAPKAILMVSGHWEENDVTIMSSPKPGMVYDYSGFPQHTYQIQYPAPGEPRLAERVNALLRDAGIKSHLDPSRGFDHGAFVPLAVSWPNADIPVVQLSIGRALAPLRDEGVLIIASGLSYHNLRVFDARAAKPSHEFDTWLQDTLLKSSSQDRSRKLIDWEKAPSSRLAHPQEDHLIPLMVAVGAAESDEAELTYHDDNLLGGIAVSSFRFSESKKGKTA
jgi:aromatic ring-opening dioxygenase catalytic subunit (LigB family)